MVILIFCKIEMNKETKSIPRFIIGIQNKNAECNRIINLKNKLLRIVYNFISILLKKIDIIKFSLVSL